MTVVALVLACGRCDAGLLQVAPLGPPAAGVAAAMQWAAAPWPLVSSHCSLAFSCGSDRRKEHDGRTITSPCFSMPVQERAATWPTLQRHRAHRYRSFALRHLAHT